VIFLSSGVAARVVVKSAEAMAARGVFGVGSTTRGDLGASRFKDPSCSGWAWLPKPSDGVRMSATGDIKPEGVVGAETLRLGGVRSRKPLRVLDRVCGEVVGVRGGAGRGVLGVEMTTAGDSRKDGAATDAEVEPHKFLALRVAVEDCTGVAGLVWITTTGGELGANGVRVLRPR